MVSLRTPHKLYKRYQTWIENAITAFGIALLVMIVLVNLPVYPPNWAPVLVVLVFLVGLYWSLPAYVLMVAVVIYPIYTISLYLAILFVAVTILGQRPFSHYLGATVLVLAVPALAEYHLHWVVPIMAGLWWGPINGFWMGALAALWGKLLGGMAGLQIDWLILAGKTPAIEGLMQRFQGLDALETLLKILLPFAPNPTVLLYHILQIAIWGMVGVFMGTLATQKWLHYRYPWSTLLAITAGVVLLALSHILLAGWLTEAAPEVLNYNYLFVAAVFSLIIGSSLEVTRKFLDLPLAPKAIKRQHIFVPVNASNTEDEEESLSKSAAQAVPTHPKPITTVTLPDLPEWKPPDEDNDLILLELD